MKNKRKILFICKEEDTVALLKLAQKLEIKFLISSDLEDALGTIKRCGQKHLSSVIADFNFKAKNEELRIEIVAYSQKFFLQSMFFINEKDQALFHDLANFLRFSRLEKYPILKKNQIDWEKAIYELNFFMTR